MSPDGQAICDDSATLWVYSGSSNVRFDVGPAKAEYG
jgi:hypothetical protein